MTYVYSLGTLMGIPGSRRYCDHGVRCLRKYFLDHEHGGWFTAIEHAPDAYGDVARMLDSCALLEEDGYAPYYLYRQKGTLQNLENTGYTKPGYAGLYNVFIMEEVHTILSAGAGGSTTLVGPDGRIQRIFNHTDPREYIERFDVVRARKQGVDDFYAKYADLDSETAR